MFPGTKILVGPRRYIQGAGVLGIVGKQVGIHGKRPLVIGGPKALAVVEKTGFFDSLNKANLKCFIETFGTPPHLAECTNEEIDRLSKSAAEKNCDLIIIIGGGKVIDAGKAAADKLGIETVTIPTVAATNAAVTAISVIYTKDHQFDKVLYFPRNPALVIVDSLIIAEAPTRYLVSGLGDAASAKFEGEACSRIGAKNLIFEPERIGRSTAVSLALCRMTYENLINYGEMAVQAASNRTVIPALELVVESVILWSGVGVEGTGVAAAHSIHNGITAIENIIPKEKTPLHGELVSFGTCLQLILENRPMAEILEYYEWSRRVGLPTTFEEIGFGEGTPTDEDLWKAAEKSCSQDESIHVMPFDVTPEVVFNAMKAVHNLGKKLSRSA